jgi:hypothetical protein
VRHLSLSVRLANLGLARELGAGLPPPPRGSGGQSSSAPAPPSSSSEPSDIQPNAPPAAGSAWRSRPLSNTRATGTRRRTRVLQTGAHNQRCARDRNIVRGIYF